MSETVAYRQKPTHTHPHYISKVKYKLQNRLKSAQQQQPFAIDLIYKKPQAAHRKAEQILLGLRQRKKRQKLQQSLPWILLMLIFVLSMTALIWTSSTPFISLCTGLLIFGSLGILVSAIRQLQTLNL